jgi:hypothetical protein
MQRRPEAVQSSRIAEKNLRKKTEGSTNYTTRVLLMLASLLAGLLYSS